MTLSRAKIMQYCVWGLILAYIVAYSYAATKAKFIGGDFVCFYSASQLLLSGDAPGVYDLNKIYGVEYQITGDAGINTIGWYYPPVFLLVVAPLAKLPYAAALFVWLAVTLAGYLLVVRKIAPHPLAAGLVLAYAGTFKNINTGQNGFLSALLLGQGLLLLERRPGWAGAVLGLLIYKPHLAILIFFALAAGKQWRALLAAGASAAVFTGVSLAFYGPVCWAAFINTLPVTTYLLENGALPWIKMTSVFSLARLLGGSISLAYGLQSISTLVAFGAVYWVWRKRLFPLAYIVLTISVFLATPYAFHYDLAITGLTLAWYGWEIYKKGWRPYEKTVLVLAWFMAVIGRYVALLTNIQVVPVVLAALLVLAFRRQYAPAHGGKEAGEGITLFSADLVRKCAWCFVFGYLVTLGGLWTGGGSGGPGQQERVMGGDFPAVYQSAQKLWSGDAAGAYETPALQETAQQAADRPKPAVAGELYPPVFFLLVAGVAALPYGTAFFAWLAVTLTGYILTVRRIAPHSCTVAAALAFPGTFQNLLHGQSGFLSALLLGQGLLLLEGQPVLAGLMLGVLVYKPQIVVLTMLALAAGRQWRALAAACASATSLLGISVFVYGPAAWQAFRRAIPAVQTGLETGALPWGSLPTWFVTARLLRFDVSWAYGIQAVMAAAAVAAVVWVWRKGLSPLACVVLTLSIFLVTPYAYQYDLAIAGLGIAWYGWEGLAKGWLPREKAVLFWAWLLPAFSSPLARATNLQIIPVVFVVILVLACRRQYVQTGITAAVPADRLAAN